MSQNFGKYKIVSQIARGGMGIIYMAEDASLNRTVAIKQLILEQADPEKREEYRQRFRREASLAAGITHTNLISIYDVSISADNSYYVMEFLQGQSLRTLLDASPGGKLCPNDFIPIFKQICAGLSHVHDMSLVHRDIKPDNIYILAGGKVKITDFGIAKSIREGDSSNLTKPGVMLGTMAYSSPEQLRDARYVEPRADVYSLGVLAYEALAGQLPFDADGLTATLMAIMSKEAKPLNEVNPEISSEIASVIAKAMRKNASDRYPAVVEFEQQFERAMGLAETGGSTTSGSMLRTGITGGGQSSSFTPGIPVSNSGANPKFTPAAGLRPPSFGVSGGLSEPQPAAEEAPRTQLVKPWLSGRTNEQNKPAAAQSDAMVKVIGLIGRAGDGPGAFQEPAAIAARGAKIVVADTSRRKFQVFGRDGRLSGESRPDPKNKQASKTSQGVFSKPSSLAIDTRGRIYAADASDHFIRIFDAQGMFMKELLNKHGKDGGILGLMCDNAGNLYLSDPDNGCVHVMSIELGKWLRKIGSKGNGAGQMQLPQGIALDRAGQLYVVDYGTSKISVFSKAGIFQRSWGGKGTGKGEFNVPRGIAIDKIDRIYVADSLNHRIQVFSTSGDFLHSFGSRGVESGRFIGPSDLSIDPNNNCLYVADRGNSRIQVFELLTS